MKNILLIATFLISAMSFGQNGVIKGSLSDMESNNDPLMFAKVSIKELGAETLTDENGLFTFENVENGSYTLVYSFVGYESKENHIEVLSGKTSTAKAALKASTISLEELMLTLASNDSEPTPITTNN